MLLGVHDDNGGFSLNSSIVRALEFFEMVSRYSISASRFSVLGNPGHRFHLHWMEGKEDYWPTQEQFFSSKFFHLITIKKRQPEATFS